ncbi:MAG: zf-HC2 domain-containing protein [Deltaproteobacteria bacterium]|nr:zf-HC2 domain-containing protein [Deltaproteobacteria bacterium]
MAEMDCTRAESLLSAYLDRDLPEREREGFSEHLRQCPLCAGEEKALKETLSLLRNLPAEKAPPRTARGGAPSHRAGKGDGSPVEETVPSRPHQDPARGGGRGTDFSPRVRNPERDAGNEGPSVSSRERDGGSEGSPVSLRERDGGNEGSPVSPRGRRER